MSDDGGRHHITALPPSLSLTYSDMYSLREDEHREQQTQLHTHLPTFVRHTYTHTHTEINAHVLVNKVVE